jgi:REP element-mobilizing transposase RayT
MDGSRFWLLTNTTYGTWLPGDARGSVTSVRPEGHSEPRIEHDIPGTPYEEETPGLERSARALMRGPAIRLNRKQAQLLLAQFRETAAQRDWTLHAVAIMANHFHLVAEVGNDPDPRKVLADFKAYGSRALNREFGKPASETWWTSNGSKRKLSGDLAVESGVHYVLRQEYALVIWPRSDDSEV